MTNAYLEKVAAMDTAEKIGYGSAHGIATSVAVADAYGAYAALKNAKRTTRVLNSGNNLADKAARKGNPWRAVRHLDRTGVMYKKLEGKHSAINNIRKKLKLGYIGAAGAAAYGVHSTISRVRKESA